jgi:SpoVK/Ycf46/Vps4 family AAA+-type ATPase
VSAQAAPAFACAADQVLAELDCLELVLRRQVLRLRAANLLTEDEFRGLYIADAHVDALLGGASPEGGAPLRELDAIIENVRRENAARESDDLPLPRLCRALGLDSFERDVVLLALAPEVDLRWETLYAYVQNDVTKRRPTVELALKLFCATPEEGLVRRSAFAADAPLVESGAVRLLADGQEPERTRLGRFLDLDDHVADFLLGQDRAEVAAGGRLLVPTLTLDALVIADRLRRELEVARPLVAAVLPLLLVGPDGTGKEALGEAVAAGLGGPLIRVDATLVLDGAGEPRAAGAALARDARLHGAVVHVVHAEALLDREASVRRRAAAFLQGLEAGEVPLVLTSTAGWDPALEVFGGRVVSVEVEPPAHRARRDLWLRALDGAAGGVDLDVVAGRFRLGPARIRDAAREAARGAPPTTDHVLAAARAHSGQELRGLAERIEPMYGWDDIVLPRRPLQALRDACTSVRLRYVVYEQWGFDRRIAYGKGVNVLFSGASGTGKTMASQIVARELDLDLYKIDLSTVVSKYIGETEQNLRRIFLAARASNAILFFDEADALFGKRSEVREAHDRYANIEVAYLLQQMEEYDGVVILATNLSKNIDEAFARRMDHAIEFPFPDEEHRERIWQIVFPAETPLGDDVDFGFLARRFELSGGNIRNIALAAAFRAAEAGRAVAMEDLILGTARELEKLSRLPTRAEFREYWDLILEGV